MLCADLDSFRLQSLDFGRRRWECGKPGTFRTLHDPAKRGIRCDW